MARQQSELTAGLDRSKMTASEYAREYTRRRRAADPEWALHVRLKDAKHLLEKHGYYVIDPENVVGNKEDK